MVVCLLKLGSVMEKDAATSGHAADWHAVKESSTLPRSPNRERLAWTWEYIGGSLFMLGSVEGGENRGRIETLTAGD